MVLGSVFLDVAVIRYNRRICCDQCVFSEDQNKHIRTASLLFCQRNRKSFKILGFQSRGKAEIQMETFWYRKSRIWEMKEEKYEKSLAKNQVYAIVHMRDIRKNVLPKIIKFCMKTPCFVPFRGTNMAAGNQQNHVFFEFSYLCVNCSLEELINIKAIFILRQGMFR